MNILLTGANGYIGKRLLPVLVNEGHKVFACLRDKSALEVPEEQSGNITVLEVDFLKKETLQTLPENIDVSFFLIHSLASPGKSFYAKEEKIAKNYNQYIDTTNAKQTIYLGGISNDEELSHHLKSRLNTEELLKQSKVPLTSLRAAIIIGSGGASFEIIRDLVEKLPVMVAPKWLNTKCQPIGIRNVIEYLISSMGNEKMYGKSFDIGGPEVLTYKQMLLQFAEVRGMKRYIQTIPVLTPRLSSYWLYFVTSTSYHIAVNLVNSMKNEVIVKVGNIEDHINIALLNYKENVSLAFKRIEQNYVVSSWVDSDLTRDDGRKLTSFIKVPQNGVFRDKQKIAIKATDIDQVINNVWSIGGDRGWYYANWLWKLRGYLDKLFGGVGLRRGRRSPTDIYTGNSLDFWRVLLADREARRLLLFAEMKLPGEAWLEFKIEDHTEGDKYLIQTATFRPKGVLGRLYWYSVLPFHLFIFKNMARNITLHK